MISHHWISPDSIQPAAITPRGLLSRGYPSGGTMMLTGRDSGLAPAGESQSDIRLESESESELRKARPTI